MEIERGGVRVIGESGYVVAMWLRYFVGLLAGVLLCLTEHRRVRKCLV